MFSRPVAPPIETLPLPSMKAPGALSMTSPKVRPTGTFWVKALSNSAPTRALPMSMVGALPVMR